MKIIFPQQNGEIAITFELEGWEMHELARMTTPNGTPYLIVNDSDLPADWSTSAAWDCDFSQPHGLGIGPQRWHIEQAQKKIDALSAILPPAAPQTIPAAEYLADEELFAMASDIIPVLDPELEGEAREAAELEVIAIKMMVREAHNASVDHQNTVIAATNESRQAHHEQNLAMWHDEMAQEVASQHAVIARMKADILLLEGVEL